MIPPGDIRNCIAALADAEPLVTRLFQYRFDDDAGEGIAGHSFGNLFIVAMSDVTGNMEEAIRETSRVLAVRGRILPSTLADVTLGARLADGSTVRGESVLAEGGSAVEQVFVEPANVQANSEAAAALLEADLIVIRAGLALHLGAAEPARLRPRRGAAAVPRAPRLRLQRGNPARGRPRATTPPPTTRRSAATSGATTSPTSCSPTATCRPNRSPRSGSRSRCPAPGDAEYAGARLVLADLVDRELRYRHDSERLAAAVMRQYYERDLQVQVQQGVAALPAEGDT